MRPPFLKSVSVLRTVLTATFFVFFATTAGARIVSTYLFDNFRLLFDGLTACKALGNRLRHLHALNGARLGHYA